MIKTSSQDFFLKGENPNIRWDNVPGFECNSTQDETLQYICSFGGENKSIFEFGTWVGRSALGFSQNYKNVITMDHKDSSDYEYSYSFQGTLREAGDLVKNVENVSIILENSLTFDFSPYYDMFDVVYVDGNHSEEGCLSDMKNALKIAKPNSIIFVDDYPWEGVRRAVDGFDYQDKYFIEDRLLVALVKKHTI
jgi:predicted O-methyltransferase YrrM